MKLLQSQKEDLLLQQNQLNNQMIGYDKELKVFEYNLRVNSSQTDLVLEKLKQVSSYHRARTNVILDRKYVLKQQIKELTNKINKLTNEINKLQGQSREEQGEIRIKLDAPIATGINLIISYNVSKTGWFPEYDLKSNSIQSDLNIVYKANVYQQTGVNRKGVDVILSTGDPSQDNNKPNLESKYLNFSYGARREKKAVNRSNYKHNPTVRMVKGVVTGSGLPLPGVNVKVVGTNIGTVTDFKGIYKINIPNEVASLEFSYIGFKSDVLPVYASNMNIDLTEDASALDEVVVIGYGAKKKNFGKALAIRTSGVRIRGTSSIQKEEEKSYNETVGAKQEGITNTSFKIKKKYTIDSNSESTAIEIDKFTLPTKYFYYVAPELNVNVFLTAILSNWEQFDLLTGEANIYFEGSYVGKALIEPNSTKEKLVLSLGVDPNIVVDRKEPKNFKSKSFAGGTRIVKKAFEISIKNNKSQAIDLIVEERIPISSNKEIKVEDVITEGAKYDTKKGIAKWSVNIPSKQNFKKKFSYTIKYPKGKRINF